MRLTWVQPEDLLLHAFVQARAEGIYVADLEERWRGVGGSLEPPVSGASGVMVSSSERALARALLAEVGARTTAAPEASADEVFIRSQLEPQLPREVTRERVLGAWLGRAVGCLLGKPVEKIPREGIRAILDDVGEWPLQRYFTAVGLSEEVSRAYPWNRRSRPTSLRENIDGMPEDDDVNYPLLGLELLETLGDEFTVDDVAASWLNNLPAGRVFTAERVAYRNLLEGVTPALCGATNNPFKEWIGAFIRGDIFGWTHPGRPREAARLAFTDATLSHVREGIYGEMWVAAASSAAVVADDLDTVLAAGASAVPGDCALLEAVEFGVAVAADRDLERGLDALHERYGHLHWVHVLNNAATTTWALASSIDETGRPDFSEAICRAVMAGWDTDSAGATTGALAGAMLGAEGLPQHWTDPIHDSYRTTLPGTRELKFTDLARRTLAIGEGLA